MNGNVAGMVEMRNRYKVLDEKDKARRQLGKLTCSWEDIKKDLKNLIGRA
jgi:hypothetical protein